MSFEINRKESAVLPIFTTHSVHDTVDLGKKLGAKLKKGDVVAYFGPMGMGKTAFTHGLAEGMGIELPLVEGVSFDVATELLKWSASIQL